MMGTTMGTIRLTIHGDPDRYRTAIGNARTRSKIAKVLAIPFFRVSIKGDKRRQGRLDMMFMIFHARFISCYEMHGFLLLGEDMWEGRGD
uniref:Uncharacterized protein n=1 Tax=Tanacetum cinerariifolium TaxID=118510 RepID=A0A6L2LEF7_TANCI|nr:hypothetical protein [Tanacetum cinerariifolium]